jgi:microcystin-dependent protein
MTIYYNSDLEEFISTGDFSAQFGLPPTTENLRNAGFLPYFDGFQNQNVPQGWIKAGISQDRDEYFQIYAPTNDLAETISYSDRLSKALLTCLVGKVSYFAMDIAPDGYLVCDGSVHQFTDYPSLGGLLGGLYGGDGTTTFAVPDLRGQFLRGWDEAGGSPGGIDPGRLFGSSQSHALESHSHELPADGVSGTETTTTTSINQATTFGNGYETNVTGLSETRPVNVALLPCIFHGEIVV